MLVEKKKTPRVNHLQTIKQKQVISLAAASKKKVSLPTFSWEKKNGSDNVGAKTRDQD
jgi:hypothetical protein